MVFDSPNSQIGHTIDGKHSGFFPASPESSSGETETVSGLVSREQIAARLSGWEGHDMRTKRAGLVQRAEDWR